MSTQGSSGPPSGRFTLRSTAEILALPPVAYRVKGVLPEQGLALLYGPSGGGKSFLTIDLGASIAEGRDWFGYATRQAPVIYLALEASGGIARRAAALEQTRGKMTSELSWVYDPFRLTDQADVQELASLLPRGAVVVIDTLNRAAPTADENSSADMGRVIEGASRLALACAGLVILVHHTGKNPDAGPRGHSSLFAAADAVIEVTRSAGRPAWILKKAKEDEAGKVHPFHLASVALPPDSDGDPQSSCVVVEDTVPLSLSKVKVPSGARQTKVFDALRHRLGSASALPEPEAILVGAGALTSEPSHRKNSRAKDTIDRLVAKQLLVRSDAGISLA